MRIETLKTTPDRAGRYWLTASDGSRLALYRQTVEDFHLYAGQELSDDQWQQLTAAVAALSAKMRAVRIVAATNVSCKNLENRLIRKGEDPAHARNAVAWMEEMHLVDDANAAEQVVHSCIAKGYGLQRAKQVLYEKQIPKEHWDGALQDYPKQLDKITAFLRTRLGDSADQKQIKKAVDALLRRGHSYGTIREALNLITLEAEEFPEE